ncbi:AlpA family phage regulatory protein [Rhodobacterales bacterium HKCCSP123]|nr:AlpA family phage regulatory protein [Rhodobacterales bacterium HKCCSP123]
MVEYLNINQLGELLGNRSRAAIYTDVERGDLPKPIKLGHRVYWSRNEVLEALKDAPRAKIGGEAAA